VEWGESPSHESARVKLSYDLLQRSFKPSECANYIECQQLSASLKKPPPCMGGLLLHATSKISATEVQQLPRPKTTIHCSISAYRGTGWSSASSIRASRSSGLIQCLLSSNNCSSLQQSMNIVWDQTLPCGIFTSCSYSCNVSLKHP